MKQLNIETLEIKNVHSTDNTKFILVYGIDEEPLSWHTSSTSAEKLIEEIEDKNFKSSFVKRVLMLAFLYKNMSQRNLALNAYSYTNDLTKQGLIKLYGRNLDFHVLASTKAEIIQLKKTIVSHNILNGDQESGEYLQNLNDTFDEMRAAIQDANEQYELLLNTPEAWQ